MSAERVPDVWAKTNARIIEQKLEAKYGDRWRHCFTEEVRMALIRSEVLSVVEGQAMDKYEPAIVLARRLQKEFTSW